MIKKNKVKCKKKYWVAMKWLWCVNVERIVCLSQLAQPLTHSLTQTDTRTRGERHEHKRTLYTSIEDRARRMLLNQRLHMISWVTKTCQTTKALKRKIVDISRLVVNVAVTVYISSRVISSKFKFFSFENSAVHFFPYKEQHWVLWCVNYNLFDRMTSNICNRF